ncbi:MAG: 4-hydroxy-tetrahydrodipicolinate reductase [Deltaproteobacteria bacterium]|jgi:4-hydroxy-tetrahydrodipicolinate reductase|nr:4-hydroxy-tetrahydrodipicolinate reductase [Deltaproteobacteria bacterium]
MSALALAVTGVLGQMGKRLVTAIAEREDLRLVGGTLKAGHLGLGQDIGLLVGLGPLNILATDQPQDAIKGAQVLVDFTSPAALNAHIKAVLAAKIPIVVGTTGLGAAELALLNEASREIPVLWAPNMSLGVNLLYKLVELAARSLGEFDLEILEAHHKRKKDAPSGTALKLAQILVDSRKTQKTRLVTGREGLVGPRQPEEIGVLALRGGDIVGEHTVYFCGQGERLELTHRAQSRDTFVAGALRAAQWLAERPKGLYSIDDVLGLS